MTLPRPFVYTVTAPMARQSLISADTDPKVTRTSKATSLGSATNLCSAVYTACSESDGMGADASAFPSTISFPGACRGAEKSSASIKILPIHACIATPVEELKEY